MSVFRKKNAIASTEFKGFEGIDATAPHGYVPAARGMVNFRVCEDGSLEKRSGFSPVAECPEKIRAVWSGKLSGKQSTFIVYGNVVAAVDPANNSLITLGNTESTEGHAKFIFFNSRLFLMDEHRFYSVSPEGLSGFEGYAPLYGKNWGSATRGLVNEPLNLATRHIRMSYNVTEALIYLCVDHVIESIDAVYLNGKLVTDDSDYYFDKSLMCVCVLGLAAGDHVDLFLTVAESEMDTSPLYSCKQSVVYGGYTDSRLFLWDGSDKDIMYASSSISSSSLAASKKVYGDTMPLYIPKTAAFTMGREGRRITAVCRQYDRLLIFTNEDTWMAQNSLENANPLNAVTVNSSRGCTSDGAAVMCGNDPICVSDGTILRWTAETDELNESNAFSISSKIDTLLDASFFTSARILLDENRSEILFSDPNNADGDLWIYNYKTENWFKFNGIGAEELFMCDDRLGFVSNDTVYLFDDSLTHDVLGDGSTRSIVAVYESNPIDLSVSGNKKRLCGMTLNASLSGGSITAEYVSEGKVISTLTLATESKYPTSFIKRLNSPRFCYLTLRLLSDGESYGRIYSTSVWAKL